MIRRHRWLNGFLALVLGWCVLSIALPQVLAQTTNSVEELQQHQQEINKKRSSLDEQQKRLQNLEQSAQQRLGGLQTNIKVTAEQIARNESQLKAANDRLSTLQTQLAKAEASYQAKQTSTAARLRFLQRQQGSRGWAVLLQSENLNDFLDRRYQLKRVYEADRTFLTQLQAEAKALEAQRQGVETQKNQVALLTQQLQAEKAEYEAEAQTQTALVNRLREDRQALEAAEEQLSQDSAKLATLIQQRIAANSRNRIMISGSGQMGFPSDGMLTSSFGYRVHPILGYSRFHSGLDFGAEYGSPIRAANPGVVIFAGWYGGYGQAVIIDHGGNVTTLYAHTSQIYVSEGQTVQRGQAVAAVGSTGLSTGPHLHFEVRLNGQPVDPAAYL